MIETQCNNCGERIKVPASAAGRRCRCPRCNALVQIKAAPARPISSRQEPESLSPADTSDEISLADADFLEETDILPAVEEDGTPVQVDTTPDSWEKRLKESYHRHAPRPKKPVWPQRLAVAGIIVLILAILAALILVLTGI